MFLWLQIFVLIFFHHIFFYNGICILLCTLYIVLKPNGLNFFSVRNYHDRFYGKGIEVQEGIYDVNGFEVRFFTDDEIRSLCTEENFYTLWLKEEYEEPVTLYIVASIKMD